MVMRQSRRYKTEQNRIVRGICVKVRVKVTRWTRRYKTEQKHVVGSICVKMEVKVIGGSRSSNRVI